MKAAQIHIRPELMPTTAIGRMSPRKLLEEYFRERDQEPHAVNPEIQRQVDNLLREVLNGVPCRKVFNLDKKRKGERKDVALEQAMAAEAIRLIEICKLKPAYVYDAVSEQCNVSKKTLLRALKNWEDAFSDMDFVSGSYVRALRRLKLI